MRRRLRYALACYLGIAVLAGFTLRGPFRLAVWFLLAGLAVKSWLAVKKEEQS